ncbi:hypothetical protein CUMW_270880, partial [Citrus unshiu]
YSPPITAKSKDVAEGVPFIQAYSICHSDFNSSLNFSRASSVRHSPLQIFTLIDMEIVVDIGDNSITRSSMRTLLPGEWIDGDIITMYADYKNMKEAEKDVTSPRCWFLPTYYSQAALADWSSLNFAQAAGFRDRYMSRLDTCEKHDSDHARLLLALYLVQSPLNKIRCRLIQEARKL